MHPPGAVAHAAPRRHDLVEGTGVEPAGDGQAEPFLVPGQGRYEPVIIHIGEIRIRQR